MVDGRLLESGSEPAASIDYGWSPTDLDDLRTARQKWEENRDTLENLRAGSALDVLREVLFSTALAKLLAAGAPYEGLLAEDPNRELDRSNETTLAAIIFRRAVPMAARVIGLVSGVATTVLNQTGAATSDQCGPTDLRWARVVLRKEERRIRAALRCAELWETTYGDWVKIRAVWNPIDLVTAGDVVDFWNANFHGKWEVSADDFSSVLADVALYAPDTMDLYCQGAKHSKKKAGSQDPRSSGEFSTHGRSSAELAVEDMEVHEVRFLRIIFNCLINF